MTETPDRILKLTGRLANGAEGGKGSRYHSVPGGGQKARCGAAPGRRSAGWSSYPGDAVTCPKCLAKLRQLAKCRDA